MDKKRLAVGLWASTTLFAAQALATVPWMHDVQQAHQLAAQQQRLVLLHFYAEWCGPCQRLDREVYPRQDVAAAITTQYVPVKIDAMQSRDIARHYQVDRFPTDVITDASGRVLMRAVTPPEPEKYIHVLNQVAASHRATGPLQPGSPASASLPPREPGSAGMMDTHGATPASMAAPNQPGWGIPDPQQSPTGPPYASGHANGQQAVVLARPVPSPSNYGLDQRNPYAAPADPDPSAATVSQPHVPHPPLALDGYCSVSLAEKETWQPGDPRWGAIHRGHTYLFASKTDQHRFLADPDRFSPVLSGFDPQRYIERGEIAIGQRQHGMWYRGKMYLFADEASLEQFQRRPEYYAQKSHELMMRGTAR